MTGLIYTAFYIFCGYLIIRFLLPRVRLLPRLWLGACLGVMLMMWMPALAAFAAGYTFSAHLLGMLASALLPPAAWLVRDQRALRGWEEADTRLGKSLLFTALPLTVLGAVLLWTHYLEPAADGSLHVGQSTYGDLNLHLSIITSMRNAAFPPDYSIYPGERLSYPFLTDSFATSFLFLGFSLRGAVLFTGSLMMLLVFSGYAILADRVMKRAGVVRLAVLLFFLNGGLGFLYAFDMTGVSLGTAGNNQLQMGTGLAERLRNILYGWYQAPANHAEFTTYNLRWSNVICDMLIPQRTILGGWCNLLPCLYLALDTFGGKYFDSADGSMEENPSGIPARALVLLGIWAGALPMIHTHCFLALALASLGWMIYDMIRSRRGFASWLLYGSLAAVLALPQLLVWTFPQAAGSNHFLSFHFNWVNNSNSNGLRDGYLWFYIKNIGLPFLMILPALLKKDPVRRFLASGAFLIFLAAELVQFQPNEYDNNKLFYVWYMLCALIAADWGMEVYEKLKGLRGRVFIGAAACILFFASGTLSVAREAVSDYQIFSAQDVETAEYIEDHTDEHAVFISWTEHINPVSALAGRTVVCGPDLWLYYHGFSTWERHADITAFYSDPGGRRDILEKYGVDYIFVGSYERAQFGSLSDMDACYPLLFVSRNGEIRIYGTDGGI